jgi:hypothetical protein
MYILKLSYHIPILVLLYVGCTCKDSKANNEQPCKWGYCYVKQITDLFNKSGCPDLRNSTTKEPEQYSFEACDAGTYKNIT